MKFTPTTAKAAIGAAAIATAGIFTAATAVAAPPTIQGFGTSEQLNDGNLSTAYTVSNLRPSNVVIPGYTPQGHLYQADITAQANSGTVTPVVTDFSARSTVGPAANVPPGAPPAGNGTTENGATYHVINSVPVPNGLSPAPITQGNQASGMLYFDVTGPPPTQVVYNDGVQDILVWTNS